MWRTISLALLSVPAASALSSVGVPTPTRTDAAVVSDSIVRNSLDDFDYRTEDRLPFFPDGYKSYVWRGEHDVNYVELGDPSKPPLLLIHGFGASAYHWRHNLPALARDFHVFAICKLGFGQSDKPVVGYDADLWRDQAVDFLRHKVRRPAVVAGNSLGGFTALAAAAAAPELVAGVVSLNGAGRFRGPKSEQKPKASTLQSRIVEQLQRWAIGASFVYTKQPLRIKQVLKQVYTNDPTLVDDDLVASIYEPSLDPNAAEVFYRVISNVSTGKGSVVVDDLLEKIECPLLLCWGVNDPWIGPETADKMEAILEANDKGSLVHRVNVAAGHCPHDENYRAVNAAIRNFANDACFGEGEEK